MSRNRRGRPVLVDRFNDLQEEAGRGRVELIPAKRRALILEKLRRDGAADIPELVEIVGASASTIRRDLEHLERQGALERTHGGATLQNGDRATFEPELSIAAQFARAEKAAIGAAAAADLRPGQSVIFDASATVLEVARCIAAQPSPLTAVTNSLAIAQVLAIPSTAAKACVTSVARAAPMTPSAGTGPQPKMNSGSSAKFRRTVPSTISSGTRVWPMPRIRAWNIA